MKVFHDYLCDEGHIHEAFVERGTPSTTCPECGKVALKQISTPTVKLEGVTGAFPGAASRWEQVRAEKLKVERKQKESHGEGQKW